MKFIKQTNHHIMPLQLIFICLFIFISNAHAKSFYIIKHKVKKNDSFISILKTYVLKQSIINKSSPMINKTMAKNPHITNWHRLKKGKTIKLYISKDLLNAKVYKRYKKKMAKTKKKKLKAILATNSEQPAPKKRFGMSLFYMTTIGNFSQGSSTQTEVSLSQNSPYTFGSLLSFRPINKKFFYSGSFYVSKLADFESKVSTKKISMPYEFGVNGYFNYSGYKFLQALYTGFDYERFSPFNLGTIDANATNASEIEFDEVFVLYLTAGIGKVITVFNNAIFMKVSLSKSIYTHQVTAPTGVALNENYSGFKSIFYINYRITKRFFVHGLYKIHIMSGDNDLNISRYGFGFGMNVF